jgi:hypothetical protein
MDQFKCVHIPNAYILSLVAGNEEIYDTSTEWLQDYLKSSMMIQTLTPTHFTIWVHP